MLSANHIKLLRSLKSKKFRALHNEFLVEGEKQVTELLSSGFRIKTIYATESWIARNDQQIQNISVERISEKDLGRISQLKTPNQVIARVDIPTPPPLSHNQVTFPVLVLDHISDPGNLGTIIRTADWFGLKTIVCSENTVDLYNPKVVQATMGSLARVNVFYSDLHEFLKSIEEKTIVYGTFMQGKDISKVQFTEKSIIIIGNESSGISESIINYIDKKVFIPPYSKTKSPESLNAAIACAITCFSLRNNQ